MGNGEEDVDQLVAHINGSLGTSWKEWPGGRPGQIESALIDAVLSIRATYGSPATDTRPATGVRKSIERYRGTETGNLDDLERLAAAEPEQLARDLGNNQRTAGNPKANAIVQAARNLVDAGVRHADHFDVNNPEQEAAYRRVRGLGWVTWSYLGMLLGQHGVKADTWIRRFVKEALGRAVNAKQAAALVVAAAERLNVPASHLDHAIWDHMRSRPRK